MWFPGHGQVGWHLAELARLEKKDRFYVRLLAWHQI